MERLERWGLLYYPHHAASLSALAAYETVVQFAWRFTIGFSGTCPSFYLVARRGYLPVTEGIT